MGKQSKARPSPRQSPRSSPAVEGQILEPELPRCRVTLGQGGGDLVNGWGGSRPATWRQPVGWGTLHETPPVVTAPVVRESAADWLFNGILRPAWAYRLELALIGLVAVAYVWLGDRLGREGAQRVIVAAALVVAVVGWTREPLARALFRSHLRRRWALACRHAELATPNDRIPRITRCRLTRAGEQLRDDPVDRAPPPAGNVRPRPLPRLRPRDRPAGAAADRVPPRLANPARRFPCAARRTGPHPMGSGLDHRGPDDPPPPPSPHHPGAYQLQAAINAVHADALTVEQTDWPQIVALYDQLLAAA
jgi:hypothetical protein